MRSPSYLARETHLLDTFYSTLHRKKRQLGQLMITRHPQTKRRDQFDMLKIFRRMNLAMSCCSPAFLRKVYNLLTAAKDGRGRDPNLRVLRISRTTSTELNLCLSPPLFNTSKNSLRPGRAISFGQHRPQGMVHPLSSLSFFCPSSFQSKPRYHYMLKGRKGRRPLTYKPSGFFQFMRNRSAKLPFAIPLILFYLAICGEVAWWYLLRWKNRSRKWIGKGITV